MKARVGLDLRPLCEEGPQRGDGLYALRLLEALLEEAPLYELVLLGYGRYEDCLPSRLWGALEWRRIPRPFRGGAADLLLQHQVLAFTAREAGLALFHTIGREATPFLELPNLVTVRRYLTPAFRPPQRGAREPLTRLALRAAARRADRVVLPSAYLARRLGEEWDLEEGRMAVVPEGVEERFRPPGDRQKKRLSLLPLGIDRPFFVYAGSGGGLDGVALSGLRLFLLALRRAVLRERRDLQAVLAMEEPGPFRVFLHDVICSMGLEKRVVTLEKCPRDLLPSIYGGALALVCLDLREDPCLPVLEAMACGTPVLASASPWLEEAAGGAALEAGRGPVEEVAARLVELSRSEGLREELGRRGLKRASRFTWKAAARGVLALYGEVLDERERGVSIRS